MSNEPPFDSANLEGVQLALRAIHEETGQYPRVISHADYWALSAEEQRAGRYLVLQPETWDAWNRGVWDTSTRDDRL